MRHWLIVVLIPVLCSCASMVPSPRNGISSSMVDYLYPKGAPPKPNPELPTLNVPLRVGLGFVPTRNGNSLPVAEQLRLLNQVRDAFKNYDFIKDIEVLPDAYLKVGGGFEGLEQVARLYDLDVMALVSYDQVTTATDNKASLLYWTIVGAYVIKGNENAVQTFVDTAVFDVASHKLLFRAPGINRLEASSTLVNLQAQQNELRTRGFELAVQDMNRNLDVALQQFRQRVKDENIATVKARPGYKGTGADGGGATGLCTLIALVATAFGRKAVTFRRRPGRRA